MSGCMFDLVPPAGDLVPPAGFEPALTAPEGMAPSGADQRKRAHGRPFWIRIGHRANNRRSWPCVGQWCFTSRGGDSRICLAVHKPGATQRDSVFSVGDPVTPEPGFGPHTSRPGSVTRSIWLTPNHNSYRLGSERGSPNHGSTLASKRVMPQIRPPARVSTWKPAAWRMPAGTRR